MTRILQLSDTHFLEAGGEPEGGFAYDTGAAFDAVFDHASARQGVPETAVDLVVVTGDIADHGRAEQYRRAAESFERFDTPVNVCPGNHDLDASYTVGMGRVGIGTSRVIESGNWCFLFVDSNAGAMLFDDSGRTVDPEPDDRLHRNGALGAREASWIREMCATTEAEHVFVWLHHPPAPGVGLSADEAYEAEWVDLLRDLPIIRGLGGGHTHLPLDYVVEGRSVFVCPALKNNFSLEAKTLLPPGYRSYEFFADGTISSELHLIDDPRWPRSPLPRSVLALLNGELTFDEFNAIVEKRRRATAES